MIQHDQISTIFIVLGAMIFIYLFTLAGSALVLFPLVLMLVGIVLHRFVQHKGKETEDFDETPITNENLWKQFIFYTVIALFGVFMVSEAISVFPLAMSPGLTGFYALLYQVLIGIAEEEFFRGFVTDWFVTSLPNPYVALLLSATFFSVYHLAVYGTVLASLAYVFFGGLILSWVSYRTLHISPCMSGHMLNNLGAYISENGISVGAGIKYAVKVMLKVI
jgi:membrane protease YdiL (CAAX protease family)